MTAEMRRLFAVHPDDQEKGGLRDGDRGQQPGE